MDGKFFQKSFKMEPKWKVLGALGVSWGGVLGALGFFGGRLLGDLENGPLFFRLAFLESEFVEAGFFRK